MWYVTVKSVVIAVVVTSKVCRYAVNELRIIARRLNVLMDDYYERRPP
jgi:hypothetical protein